MRARVSGINFKELEELGFRLVDNLELETIFQASFDRLIALKMVSSLGVVVYGRHDITNLPITMVFDRASGRVLTAEKHFRELKFPPFGYFDATHPMVPLGILHLKLQTQRGNPS